MKKILLGIFFILVLSVNAYAANNQNACRADALPVYTWGYGVQLEKMMQVTSTLMGYTDYHGGKDPAVMKYNYGMIVKITLLISTLVIFLSLLSDKGFAPWVIVQKLFLVFIIQMLLTASSVTVKIIDKQYSVIGATELRCVEKVPVLIGYPLWILSNIEYAVKDMLTKSILDKDQNFLNNGSIITALNVFQTGLTLRVSDPNFIKSYGEFMENCVLPEIFVGNIDLAKIDTMNAADFINEVNNIGHPARITMLYKSPQSNGVFPNQLGNVSQNNIVSCSTAGAELTKMMDTVYLSSLQSLQASLGNIGVDKINTLIGGISSSLTNYQKDGATTLKYAMMNNTFNDSYATIAEGMGLNTGALGYSMAKAQETARLNASMQAIMAKKYLPVAKGYLTVIFVAIIPIIMLISLATNNFIKPFAMIFGILIALSLWGIGEQLLDFLIYLRLKAMWDNAGAFTHVGNGFTSSGYIFMDNAITETLTLSLGMYWMIPTLAFSIATLSGYAASSMMSGISGIANAGVSGAAAEAAGGNMAMGNIRMNAVNMNKYDSSVVTSAGYSNKLSMDNQQTASNQSFAKTGVENTDRNVDEIIHKGSTWITDDKTGKLYEVNGTFESVSGGWNASGVINEYDKKGNLIGSYKGDMSGTGNMSDYQKNVIEGGHGGKENAFHPTSIDNKNFSASNITRKDQITTENTVDEHKQVTDHSKTTDYSETYNKNKTDSEIIKIEKGTVISDEGKSYKYNSNAIVQDIQSKHDANGSLDMIRQKYDYMKAMEAANDPMAVAARTDYEKAITAYSLAAAQGLPVTSTVGESDKYDKSRNTSDYQDGRSTTKGSLGIGIGGPGSGGKAGASQEISYTAGTRTDSTYSSSEDSQRGVTLDTTALKIRAAIENGFNNGNSNENILNSLGDRETYR